MNEEEKEEEGPIWHVVSWVCFLILFAAALYFVGQILFRPFPIGK